MTFNSSAGIYPSRADVMEHSASTVVSDVKSQNHLRTLGAQTTETKEYPSSSTHLQIPSEAFREQIYYLFKSTKDGFFEDRFREEFSTKLASLIRRYGEAAIVELAPLVIQEGTDAEVASEILTCLSHMTHASSYNARLWLILRSLECTSSWIRDSAVLSLASMDDPSSSPYLQKALERETNEELRLNIRPALEFLQRSR